MITPLLCCGLGYFLLVKILLDHTPNLMPYNIIGCYRLYTLLQIMHGVAFPKIFPLLSHELSPSADTNRGVVYHGLSVH